LRVKGVDKVSGVAVFVSLTALSVVVVVCTLAASWPRYFWYRGVDLSAGGGGDGATRSVDATSVTAGATGWRLEEEEELPFAFSANEERYF
jgi:hypothetical protein